jgi:hypothetical protein
MSNLNASNGKTELQNLIPTVWSSRFYEQLKNNLYLASVFSRDYEGEIKNKGDKVKVNQIVAPAAQTITDDKEKFTSGGLVINQKEMTVNRRTVDAVEISDLALLQSESFMEDLKREMGYQLALKMEQEIITELRAGLTTYAIAASGTYAKNDWVNARTKAASLLWSKMPKFSAFGVSYYGDLLKDNNITSADWVDGKPLMDQQLPNALGFRSFEHDLLGNDEALHFHYSALQMAIQKGVNFKISDLHGQNKFAYLLSVDCVWDMEIFDASRAFFQGNSGTAIGV